MGGGASAPMSQTLDDLISSSGSEGEYSEEEQSGEESEEDNLLELRRAANKKKPKASQPVVVKEKKGKAKKKLPRNVVTDQMRWQIPERYKYPQPEGQVEIIKDPVDGKLRPRTDYRLGGPSQFSAFWRGRLGPLNDMLNLDGTLKKQKRPAHGGIRGAPEDKWANGGKKFKEREMLKGMTEKEKSRLRKQKRAQAAKRKHAVAKASGSSAAPADGAGAGAAAAESESEEDDDDNKESGGSPKADKKTSASFRFKSPSKVFAGSFISKSFKSKSFKSKD
jgi:hypothetical protein